MQTFLPYSDFELSAQVLDKKRCWKQVVETSQILDVLKGKKVGWANHPAVKMWGGYIPALELYFNSFWLVATQIHKIKTKYSPIFVPLPHEMPWWLGDYDFHRAMRARLIEKDRDFYGKSCRKNSKIKLSGIRW
jgi:hypothetical protein